MNSVGNRKEEITLVHWHENSKGSQNFGDAIGFRFIQSTFLKVIFIKPV
jgi:hypothetical protein